MLTNVGTIDGIYRAPVKSTVVEELDAAEIGVTGLIGNRRYVAWDPARQMVITAKQTEGVPLLACQSFSEGEATHIRMPDGLVLACDSHKAAQALSELLGFRVELIEPEKALTALRTNAKFSLRRGMGVDSAAISLITTSSFRAADIIATEGVIRFSPTVVVKTDARWEGFLEDNWRREVHIREPGSTQVRVRLGVRKPTERCARPARRHGLLPADNQLLGRTKRCLMMPDGELKQATFLGISLAVLDPGPIFVGDEVWVEL